MDWNFVDDGTDGPNDYWRMCVDGVHYPKLSWESGRNGDFACPEGVVMDDLEALALHWLTMEEGNLNFNYAVDGSGDGVVDLNEMGILSENWD